MAKTKNVSKKLVKKLVSKPKSTVTMLEYSIKMIIPTGVYSNIQPEIKVSAATPEEAHEYIAPHMNKLWKEYFMVGERRQEVAPVAPTGPVGTAEPTSNPTGSTGPMPATVEAPPASNVALIKATQAIESCLSLEALDLIKNQVELSVKLSKEEKPKLRVMIVEKFNELNADAFIKKNA